MFHSLTDPTQLPIETYLLLRYRDIKKTITYNKRG